MQGRREKRQQRAALARERPRGLGGFRNAAALLLLATKQPTFRLFGAKPWPPPRARRGEAAEGPSN